MRSRSELRDIIVKVLYQKYIYDSNNIKYDIKKIIKDNIKEDNDFVCGCINGIIDNEKALIDLANKYLKNWNVDRLGKVDKAILLLGIYEIVYTDTPDIVCINEALELSKKYSDEKVSSMINATLDKILHDELGR